MATKLAQQAIAASRYPPVPYTLGGAIKEAAEKLDPNEEEADTVAVAAC